MGDFFDHKDSDALPVHIVEIETFYISKYEITYEQYDRYSQIVGIERPDDNGYGRGRRAVVNVTWDQANAFCHFCGYRLPTEAEWEYAARSGGLEQLYAGTNNIQEMNEYAHHKDNSLENSLYVGSKKPNLLGLYDMNGNAYEWIGDFYAQYPQPGQSPVWADLAETQLRIIRGGSFKTGVLRTYERTATLRDSQSDMIGFRCVKPVAKWKHVIFLRKTIE